MDTVDRLDWRTSSRTDNGQACIEVAPTRDAVLVRDTKDHGAGPVIEFSHDQWATFVHDVQQGGTGGAAISSGELVSSHDGIAVRTCWHLRGVHGSAVLHFTQAEWEAFVAGAQDGEFDFPGIASLAVA